MSNYVNCFFENEIAMSVQGYFDSEENFRNVCKILTRIEIFKDFIAQCDTISTHVNEFTGMVRISLSRNRKNIKLYEFSRDDLVSVNVLLKEITRSIKMTFPEEFI